MAKDDCPCGSGKKYRDCCRPFHKGEAEPPSCEALVRSRFSAYALKEIDYLYRTTHPEHPDRAQPEAEVKRVLRSGANALKFVRLHILDQDQRAPGETSRVLFAAEIYEQGRDRGFIEASNFKHDGSGWRYLSGVTAPLKGRKLEGLKLANFSG